MEELKKVLARIKIYPVEIKETLDYTINDEKVCIIKLKIDDIEKLTKIIKNGAQCINE